MVLFTCTIFICVVLFPSVYLGLFSVVLGFVGFKLCLWQCRHNTPQHGVILITQSDNYIELQGSHFIQGRVADAELLLNILCLRIAGQAGAKRRVFIIRDALSAQDWSRLCRCCLGRFPKGSKQ
nr:protein YgfX [Pseudoalteromonas sp. CIP111854]